jgi:hypothetical protein
LHLAEKSSFCIKQQQWLDWAFGAFQTVAMQRTQLSEGNAGMEEATPCMPKQMGQSWMCCRLIDF